MLRARIQQEREIYKDWHIWSIPIRAKILMLCCAMYLTCPVQGEWLCSTASITLFGPRDSPLQNHLIQAAECCATTARVTVRFCEWHASSVRKRSEERVKSAKSGLDFQYKSRGWAIGATRRAIRYRSQLWPARAQWRSFAGTMITRVTWAPHSHRLQLESVSNFASIRGNVCIYQGQWQYEVTLLTSGISQLGWASPQCAFTDTVRIVMRQLTGVASLLTWVVFHRTVWGTRPIRTRLMASASRSGTCAIGTTARAGRLVRACNNDCDVQSVLIERIFSGDVIGCCIDADQGNITYYRNGKSLGVAFANIRTHQPGTYLFLTRTCTDRIHGWNSSGIYNLRFFGLFKLLNF